MTLQEKLAVLTEISPQTIRGNFTFEEFKFEILEQMASKQPDFDGLSTLFIQVDALVNEHEAYNVFTERLALKMFYLASVYDIDYDFLNAMLMVEPVVKLDQKLENDIFSDDQDFQYVKEAFKEHKVNNGLSLSTIMKYMSTVDLQPLVEQLKDGVGDLNKLAKSS